MMLLTMIMTLRIVTPMKRNFSKESSPLYILFWLLHFKQKMGENWSDQLPETTRITFLQRSVQQNHDLRQIHVMDSAW